MKSLSQFNIKSVLLILLIFSCTSLLNAQKISNVISDSKNGLRTTTFKTEKGDIKVYLPTNVYAGDVISGTVIVEPKGKNEKQITKNKNILNGYVIELAGKETPVKKGKEKWILPNKMETEILPLELKSPKGKTLSKASIPTKTETRPLSLPDLLSEVDFNIPSYFRAGEPTVIPGVFDGDFLNSAIQINDIDANILAESPEGLFFEAPVDISGLVDVKLTEGDFTMEKQTNVLDLSLSADKLQLIKGEKTIININVSGLQGIGYVSVPIEITNLTPTNINIDGGNKQVIHIQAEEINNDGIYSKQLGVRATRAGGFSVMVNIEAPEPGFIKLISPIGEIYDSPASQPIAFEWKTFGRSDNYTLQIWQLPDNFVDNVNYGHQGLYVDNFLDPLPANIKELTESEPYFMKEGIEGTTFIYPHDFEVMLAARDRYEEEDEYFFCWQVEAQSGEREITESEFGIFQVRKRIDPHKKDTETKKPQSKTEPVEKGDEPNKKKPYEEFKEKLEAKKKQLSKTPIEKQDELKKDINILEGKYITSLGKNCRYEILDKIVQEKEKELIKKERELELAKKNVKDAEKELKKAQGELTKALVTLNKAKKDFERTKNNFFKNWQKAVNDKKMDPESLGYKKAKANYEKVKKEYEDTLKKVDNLKKRISDAQKKKLINEQKTKQLEKEISALKKRISEITNQAKVCRKMRETLKKVEEAKKEKARKIEEAQKKAENEKCKDGRIVIIRTVNNKFEFLDNKSKIKIEVTDPNTKTVLAATKMLNILKITKFIPGQRGGGAQLKIGAELLKILIDNDKLSKRDFDVKLTIKPTKIVTTTCVEQKRCVKGKWVNEKKYGKEQIQNGEKQFTTKIMRFELLDNGQYDPKKMLPIKVDEFVKGEKQKLDNIQELYKNAKENCKITK